MAERRLHGLQRVLGVNALSSTAYGNVGSSIYYALGLVASYALAWGQMLNYVITIAISAFFVPHYIGGLFWPFLKTSPGDIIFGIAVVARLCGLNVIGVKEAARVNIVLGGHGLRHPAAAGDGRRRARPLRLSCATCTSAPCRRGRTS